MRAPAVSSLQRSAATFQPQARVQPPQPAPSGISGADDVVGRMVEMVNDVTGGGGGHVQIRLSNFFDAVFHKHSRAELEEAFSCGTPRTTPPLSAAPREWPHPWVYSRVFLMLFLTFLVLLALCAIFDNPVGYPGLMFVAALMVPFSVTVFFFETNIPRNVSLPRVMEIFFLGGALSLAYPVELIIPGGGSGAVVPSLITGLTEEIAKVALVALFLNGTKDARGMKARNPILSGMLIGSAVGAGFSVYETAGYIFYNGFYQSLTDGSNVMAGMLAVTWVRALTAIGGHVAWAAIEGGALALCDEGRGFRAEHLCSKRFMPFFFICVVLHGVWDMDIPVIDAVSFLGLYPSTVLLIAAVWVVVFSLMHRGIAQVSALAAGAPSYPSRS